MKTQKKILSEHAQKEKPNESCAMLFGTIDNQNVMVNEIFLTKNIEKSPINFAISNDELIEGYNRAEGKKMDVVGIFHSHPKSMAVPSNTDEKFMQINPVIWVIYSGILNEFKAYTFTTRVIEVPIEFLRS